jgi:hypothetical protein
MTQKNQQVQASEMEAQEQQVQAPEKPQQSKGNKKPVNPANYSKFTDLKFLSLSGAKLKEQQEEELKHFEKEIKGCSGPIAKRTVRAAIKNEQVLMVEGLPVPDAIEALIIEEGSQAYYFV